jgi:hypothetical protein
MNLSFLDIKNIGNSFVMWMFSFAMNPWELSCEDKQKHALNIHHFKLKYRMFELNQDLL